MLYDICSLHFRLAEMKSGENVLLPMKPSNLVTVKSVKLSPAELQKLSEEFDLETQETRREQRYKAECRQRTLDRAKGLEGQKAAE